MISCHPDDLFESDATIQERRLKACRQNYTKGHPLRFPSKLLSMSPLFHLPPAPSRQSPSHSAMLVAVLGDASGTVYLVNLTDRIILSSLSNLHQGPISAITVLLPTLTIIVGSWDRSFSLLSIQEPHNLALSHKECNAHLDFIKCIQPVNETSFVTAGVDKSCRIWHLLSHQKVSCQAIHFLHKRSIEDLKIFYSPLFSSLPTAPSQKDGPFLLTASSDTCLHYASLSDGHILTTLKGHHTSVNTIFAATLPNGDFLLLSGSADKRLIQWDTELASASISQEWFIGAWIKSIAFSASFLTIFVGTADGYLILIDYQVPLSSLASSYAF
jgi:WD40 repeat protein